MNIYKDCCLYCGKEQESLDERGLFAMVTGSNHNCGYQADGNTVLYTGVFGMRQFKEAISRLDGGNVFDKLINYEMFPHLKANSLMSAKFVKFDMWSSPYNWRNNLTPKHPLEEMLYGYGREFDRKILARMQNYIELEKDLMFS